MTTCHLLERRWAGRRNPLSWDAESRMEFRAATDESGPVAVGYAAVFGRNSVNLAPSWCDYTVVEVIDSHAFDRTVREADVVALWNHRDEALLGRVKSGTLRLTIDTRGLAYEIDLPDTTDGRDVAELLRRGDLRGSSFGFIAREQEWREDADGNITRTLLEVALIDVCPVTNPAYPDTEVALRSLAAAVGHPVDEVRAAVEARSLGNLITLPTPPPQPPPPAGPVGDEVALRRTLGQIRDLAAQVPGDVNQPAVRDLTAYVAGITDGLAPPAPTPDPPAEPAPTHPEQRDEHPDAPATGDPVAVARRRHAWLSA